LFPNFAPISFLGLTPQKPATGAPFMITNNKNAPGERKIPLELPNPLYHRYDTIAALAVTMEPAFNSRILKVLLCLRQ
jgi:hypothetical protein